MDRKILTFTSWGTALPHVTAGYVDAFRQMGEEILCLDIEELQGGNKRIDGETLKRIIADINDFRPDFAFFYAMLGIISISKTPTHLLEGLGIPHASIFYDDPLPYLRKTRKDLLEREDGRV